MTRAFLAVELGATAPQVRSLVSRKERERATCDGPDGAEVALVEREQSSRSEAMGKHDDRQVRKTEVEISVPPVEPEGHAVFSRGESFDAEPALGDIVKESPRRFTAAATTQEVVDLGGHRRRHDQVARLSLQEVGDRSMMRVPRVAQSDQRSRVDDEGHAPKPRRSSSSGTSATEEPSPSHASASAKSRRTVLDAS